MLFQKVWLLGGLKWMLCHANSSSGFRLLIISHDDYACIIIIFISKRMTAINREHTAEYFQNKKNHTYCLLATVHIIQIAVPSKLDNCLLHDAFMLSVLHINQNIMF